VTSIERTAYPRFKRLITAHELHLFFAPTREEAAWAAERMDSDGHQLALLLALKSYQLKDPFGRYVLTTFVKGTNMGPYEAAKHIPGVSGHELSYVANRHFSITLLNEAVADLVNAHARLDISQAWGDGTAVAADGTHMDTYLNNLLAETSVRYGKAGGIAYHHISDTYTALFTHFIPCGVWEAV
jgi:hypothetical protein